MGDNIASWQFWIDTGGTFTDCIGIDPSTGKKQRIKVLSSSCLRGKLMKQIGPDQFVFKQNWPIQKDIFQGYTLRLLKSSAPPIKVLKIDFDQQTIILDQPLPFSEASDFEITAFEEAPILAARILTQTPLEDHLPPIDMKLGSSKGTNALLEKKGAKSTLLITEGFEDLLLIGDQQRPHLFQLGIPLSTPLYEQVIPVPERVDAKGLVLKSLHINDLKSIIGKIETEVVVVALMNSYLNPIHENQIKQILDQQGFKFVSLSHELSPTINLLPRTQSSLVNGYLSPIFAQYLENIHSTLSQQSEYPLKLMNSTGGLSYANAFQPKDSLLSGPAGGVIGAQHIAQRLGYPQVITLDMGGTSTDTSIFKERLDYQFLSNIGGIEMTSPSLAIETVAAGGGSICSFDGNKLIVGPESAGADPGPACYGSGGPLTLTDVNLLLGKMDPAALGIPIHIKAAEQALLKVQTLINLSLEEEYAVEDLLKGFEDIANQKMAEAIKKISVAKGIHPKSYALLAFGGAGGMHACKIAELLEIKTLLLPYDSGVLSAVGVGNASVERIEEMQINQPLVFFAAKTELLLQELWEKASDQLAKQGLKTAEIVLKEVLIYLRFEGQSTSIEIPYETGMDISATFKATYLGQFGYFPENLEIEVESMRLIAQSKPGDIGLLPPIEYHYQPEFGQELNSKVNQAIHPIYDWDKLEGGAVVSGPCILRNANATAFIEEGWQVIITEYLDAVIQCIDPPKRTKKQKEAVEFECFTNRFSSIAEEMGTRLQRTAFSVNIKARQDFSCAILDPQGYLLVNAPSIPAHLGGLGLCTRLVKAKLTLEKGDIAITNHPKYGGSNLPDITLISPVFTDDDKLIGYVLNRAHHSEIGGTRPGSMPPDATVLEEEGVVIPPMYLKKGSEMRMEAIKEWLLNATHPTRSINENLSDINAAVASLQTGKLALKKMVEEYGLDKVHHYMNRLKLVSQKALKEAIKKIPGRIVRAKESLDDDHDIQVKIEVKKDGLLFDFTGTSRPHPNNLNANLSIVYSAVIYVVRLLVNQPIPLNGGLMEIIQIKLPKSLLNPKFQEDPSECPAIVGGKTEVSQRLVDTLLKALELAACSQGTMNNFLFGNTNFGYYETIGGGVGATEGHHGRSGTHQHMTNTKITDPEELEHKFPVRLVRFGLRKGSGGNGKWKGGDGIVREIEFLETVDMTILSQHRKVAPYGMHGGQEGKIGQQYIIRTNGWREYLQGIDSEKVHNGDRIIIKTPGGGGWGPIPLDS